MSDASGVSCISVIRGSDGSSLREKVVRIIGSMANNPLKFKP